MTIDANRFAALAFERARLAAPLITAAIAATTVLSEPSGIPLPFPIAVVNCITFAIGVFLSVLTRRSPSAARYGHLIASAVWILAPVNTICSTAITHNVGLSVPMLLEISIASVLMIDTRWLVGCTTVVGGTWIALDVSYEGTFSFAARGVMGAMVATLIVHLLLRKILERAEATASELARAIQQLRKELEERLRTEAEKEMLREQFVHAQRMEAVGALAAGLAHDMNNILGGVIGLGETIRDDTEGETRVDAESLIQEAHRGARLTRSLLAFGRRGQYQRQPTSLETISADVRLLLGRTLPKQVSITTAGDADVFVDVDRAQITQALVNLCLNAADAMSGSGVVTLAIARSELDAARADELDLAAGGYVVVSVGDTGRGIDPKIRRRIFEPFFTTKPPGQGSGLGLAMVWGTIHGHGGAIEVESEIGRGSTFRILLPIVEPEVDAGAPPVVGSGRRTGLVLVIDDEPLVQSTIARALGRAGYEVITADNGVHGVEVFTARHDEIDVVVMDMSMPVMSGAECFVKLRALKPVPIVIMSGYTIEANTRELLSLGNAAFLEKPFRHKHLIVEIQRLLAINVAA